MPAPGAVRTFQAGYSELAKEEMERSSRLSIGLQVSCSR
jgi:hypothetical protein